MFGVFKGERKKSEKKKTDTLGKKTNLQQMGTINMIGLEKAVRVQPGEINENAKKKESARGKTKGVKRFTAVPLKQNRRRFKRRGKNDWSMGAPKDLPGW